VTDALRLFSPAIRGGADGVRLGSSAMSLDLVRARQLLFTMPRQAKLAYCLLRDPRVPRAPKMVLGGAMGVIVGPFDVPGWIPVLGQLDMLAMSVLAVRVFVRSCPEDLVAEHEAALKIKSSIFNQDLQATVGATALAGRSMIGRLQRRIGR